ncbi:MAG: hypothetical protein U0996_19430 [Planctomycetaceae bacterium]
MLSFLFRSSQRRRRSVAPMLAEVLEARTLLAAANPLISINGTAPTILPFVNGRQLLAFVGPSSTDLYTTNGTQTGTSRFATIPAVAVTDAQGLFNDYAVVGTEVYFAATGTNGTELWKTDGTAVGTSLILDISSGPDSSSPSGFAVVNGYAYFAATTPGGGRELWKSAGTAATTTQVADIVSGADSSNPDHLIAYNGQVFFQTKTTDDVYRTDGTTAGTLLVTDGNFPDSNEAIGTFPVGIVNGRLIIKREHVIDGTQILSLSSASASPIVIKSFSNNGMVPPSLNRFVTDGFTVAGGRLYFRRKAYITGEMVTATWGELWQTTGTAAGTTQVNTSTLLFGSGDSFPERPLRLPRGAFLDGAVPKFVFDDPSFQFGSYWSDGTTLNQFFLPVENLPKSDFVQLDSELFYLSSTSLMKVSAGLTTTVEIPGTEPLLDGQPYGLKVMLGRLWFSTSTALWKYEPAAAARSAGPVITSPLTFVGPAQGQTNPASLTTTWNPVANALGYYVSLEGPGDLQGPFFQTETSRQFQFVSAGTYRVNVRALLPNNVLTEMSSQSFEAVSVPKNFQVLRELPFEEQLEVGIIDSEFPTNAWVHVIDRFTGETVLSQAVTLPAGNSARTARVSLPKSKLPGHHSLIVRMSSSSKVTAPSASANVDVSYAVLGVTYGSNFQVTLNWPQVTDAVAYDVWVNDDTNAVSQFRRDTNVLATSWTSTFLTGTFRAWVRAKLTNGSLTAWSVPQAFTVDGPIRVVNPAGTFVDGRGDEIFQWSQVKGATKYHLVVNSVTTGTQIVNESDLPATSTNYASKTDLIPGTYNAWVRSKAANGTWSAWSPVRTFTITAKPIVITGGTGATFDRTPTLTWQAGPMPMTYEVWISRRGQSTALYRRTGLTDLTHTVDTALAPGEYDVWVRGTATGGIKTAWGTASRLTIGFGSPGSALAAVGRRLLSWSPIASADSYELYMDYLGGASPAQQQIVRLTGLTDTSYLLGAALPAGRYRAWIRAVHTENGATFYSAWVATSAPFTIS